MGPRLAASCAASVASFPKIRVLVAVDQIDGVVNPNSVAMEGNSDLGTIPGLGVVLAAGLLDLIAFAIVGRQLSRASSTLGRSLKSTAFCRFDNASANQSHYRA
jgi:hypothetical protein